MSPPSDKKPPHPDKPPPSWFDKQGKTDNPDTAERRRRLLDELPKLKERLKERTRAQRFEPYLLIRSVLGDRGDRPINVPFWESPDIWTAAGPPSTSPAVPPDHGGTLVAGTPNTVYAHVWNLGFAPLAGVHVEFYWLNPSLGIVPGNVHLIGMATCELSGRGMAGSHKLVKCPKPWVPTIENGGHECLIVRVSGLGDPVGGNAWSPWANRHVGQRNVSVVASDASAAHLVDMLNLTRPKGSRLQVVQLGPKEGAFAAQLVAPRLRVSPQVSTHLLGEITAAGAVTVATPTVLPAAMMAPVHLMAAGAPTAPPPILPHDTVAVIQPTLALRGLAPVAPAPAQAHLSDLLGSVERLHATSAKIGAPGTGDAHVLRVATYQGDQLVGGYTMVIGAGRT